MRAFSPYRSRPSQSQSQSHPLLPLHTAHISNPTSPPRPIASVLLPPPSLAFLPASASEASADGDFLRALARQTTHLQKTLQQLLDAQSAGLLAGLGAGPQAVPLTDLQPEPPRPQVAARYHDTENASSDEGSRTPTTRGSSLSRGGSTDGYARSSAGGDGQSTSRYQEVPTKARRIPQAQTRISLRAARIGILRGLHELAHVKTQEREVLLGQLTRHEEVLLEMSAAGAKKRGIEREIGAIEQDDREGRGAVEALEKEEEEVQREITEMEERLAKLKARLRRVKVQKEERVNRLEAKLSSWRAALGEVERGVGENWLSGPGARVESSAGKGVWTLPRERRTLGLVEESVQEEKVEVDSKIAGVEREREACLSGAVVWESVIFTVNKVENQLKVDLGHLGSGQRTQNGKVDRRGDEDGDAGQHGIEAVLQHMTTAMSTLSSQLDLAGAQGWKLLVCSIGAELEALREGREMLLSALEQSGFLPREGDLELLDEMAGREVGGGPLKEAGSDFGKIHGSTLLSSASQSFHTTKDTGEGRSLPLEEEAANNLIEEDVPEFHEHSVERSEDEDDGPGLELLIEQ